MLSVIAEGSFDLSSLGPLGIHAGTQVGDVTTLRVPKDKLAAFLALPGLRNVRLARTLTPNLDVSVPAIHANLLWQEPSPSQGEGVLVGIVDSGIDVTHLDFKTTTGKTRIINVWDQTVAVQNPPPNFTYGRQWTSAEIDAGQCTEVDLDGHGTFLAGIAAGNGQATGNGQPAFKYIGVAPKADIAVVKTRGLETDIVDGVNYIFQVAARRSQNAVVCIAYGTQDGAHDGTDPMEASLNQLSGPGKIVCAAAGNDGDQSIHNQATIAAGTGVVTFSVPAHATGGNQWVYIDGWYEKNVTASVSLRTPKGKLIGPLARGQSYYQDSGEGFINFVNGAVTNSQGDPEIVLSVANGTEVTSGVWTITLTSTNTGAVVDFWIWSTSFNGQQATMTGVPTTLTAETVVIPATADSVLSAGAFSTKVQWVAQNGSTFFLVGATNGNIAPWSSKGPTRDGRTVPDLAGPGYGVGSAKSSRATVSPTRILQDGVHYFDYGTSAAAAHLAGSVALELQRHKGMSVNGMRQLLRGLAVSDANTLTTPNATWGYGKLCLKNCTDLAVGVDDAIDNPLQFAPPYPNPTPGALTLDFFLSPSDLLPDTKVSVDIVDVRGRLVFALAGDAVPGPQRLIWNGQTNEGTSAPGGLYFARLHLANKTLVRRFVRIGS